MEFLGEANCELQRLVLRPKGGRRDFPYLQNQTIFAFGSVRDALVKYSSECRIRMSRPYLDAG